MGMLTIRIFPLAALLLSIFACLHPAPLDKLGSWIVPLLGIIMFGMGTTLSLKDFAEAVKRPKAVCIGFILQFTVMPLLAFSLGHLMRLPHEQLIGLVMVGSVAGGTASNVITYLAGGDVALSITMTACSTLGGIFLTPLLSSLYLGQSVDVPVLNMFKSILLMVALPVTLGIICNRLMRNRKKILDTLCPLISVFGIVLVIGIIVALNQKAIHSCGLLIFLAVVLHNGCGMGLGYGIARLLRCDHRTAVTIAIETGMQNSGLAAALSKQFFGIATALPGAIFSIWHNLSGAFFAFLVRRKESVQTSKDDA